ncbi:MATE family efflux transporter [Shewanella sp. Choline-02u-19]|jgi:MATE family multidrug resistance protein|uniref:MATE family efflux transporter n=1 Tax=unclassified Shewanella TaxID=196818 RepID=UPI000C32BE83|nr:MULTISPECIES: MATE family efflux transporter [unclassified Shewanella]PKG58755.1 MATE family efflux transporter [Shewanella sp. GutDb-MelDb]PKH58025.1 MATE family efflux transporter [Shewanella sp. Bg11-22]PKI27426.1 MATE family efflux transporter [Shewanella sp. Choline-02u-19]
MNHSGFQAKRLIQLALPVLIAQVTQTMMGFIDTVMAGRVSAVDMAAVAIGSSLWLPALLFVQGLLMAFTPVFAHHHGANDQKAIQPLAFQAGYIAIIGSVGVMFFLSLADNILTLMDLEPQLAQLSVGYLNGFMWGVPAFVLYQVLRGCSEGISYTLPTMVIGFVGLAVNIPANYIFIYGHFGMPAMGGAGCGIATALVFWAMLIAMIIYMQFHAKFKELAPFKSFHRPNVKVMVDMTKHGFPIAMALFFEVSLFAIIALLLAPLGATIVAGHQIALNFSSIVFMLPLSIGIAVSIRVGYYLGQDKPAIAAMITRLGLIISFSLALFTAIITVTFRNEIALLYNDNPDVITLAGSLMFFAAIYQLSDAVQVVTSGALRGYKDTRSAFYITLVSYWAVGMTLGYTLARTDILVPAMGAQGFWIGLIAGLTTAAILFAMRLRYIQKRGVKLSAM